MSNEVTTIIRIDGHHWEASGYPTPMKGGGLDFDDIQVHELETGERVSPRIWDKYDGEIFQALYDEFRYDYPRS